MSDFRIERDSMGEMKVPADALWGAQTQRAVENFPVSGIRFPRRFIEALGLIKLACAQANAKLGQLDPPIADLIEQAAREVIDGRLDVHFPLDIYQTGSGTSSNMNANEVIANRARQRRGGAAGGRTVHPNDHVNMGQSSNDVFPTAMHVSAVMAFERDLIPALRTLHDALEAKARQFDPIVKTGRTHLQDATPIRLGQEFSGYAAQVRKSLARLRESAEGLRELPLGGTAVGTGINRLPEFPGVAVDFLNASTGERFRETDNHFEGNAARDAVVHASGALRTAAVALMKIANDVRWLSCGPRAGISEIRLPAVQPGSSIMPGKVNPVMAEAVTMVCAQVMGNDVAIGLGGQAGNFELNVMMPVMIHNLLQSISLMANAARLFAERCVGGIEADEEKCRDTIEKGLMLATALAPSIGYDQAAALAKEAYQTGKTIRQLATEKKVLPTDDLNRVLDARAMTEPGIPTGGPAPAGG